MSDLTGPCLGVNIGVNTSHGCEFTHSHPHSIQISQLPSPNAAARGCLGSAWVLLFVIKRCLGGCSVVNVCFMVTEGGPNPTLAIYTAHHRFTQRVFDMVLRSSYIPSAKCVQGFSLQSGSRDIHTNGPCEVKGLKSAPSPPEPNVVCPNGPKELRRGLFVCVPL